MYGSKVGELSVYLQMGNQQSKEPIWKKENSHGEHWNLGLVSYVPTDGDMNVTNFIIEAHTGDGQYHYGDIAIGN